MAHPNTSSPESPQTGRLYLIPTPLGSRPENNTIPDHVIETVHGLDTFFVERIRRANSFLRWIKHPLPDYKCRFYELNKHTSGEDLLEMLSLLKKGGRAGIISEAGCPSVADPGSNMVRLAHESGIPVTPLVGPSSILLALMGSGLNGQSFTFHGYLPKPGRQRTEQIRYLQKESARTRHTQIFMETPFRNNDLLDELIRVLEDDTLLSVASNLTLASEKITTCRIADWKKRVYDLNQQPAIFLIQTGSDKQHPEQQRHPGSAPRKKGRSQSKSAGKPTDRPGKTKPAHGRKRVKNK